MRKGILIAILVLLPAALLAGCYGGGMAAEVTESPLPSGVTASPKPTLNPELAPEQLITAQEAAALLGVERIPDRPAGATMPPNSIPTEGMTLAFYDGGNGKFLQITLHQRAVESDAIKVPKDAYDRLKRNAKDPVVVEDIGDDAFIAPPGLHMMANGYYVMIAAGDPANAATVEILKNAGKLVAEKLSVK